MGLFQVCDTVLWFRALVSGDFQLQETFTIVAIPAVACISAGHSLGNNPVPGF